ncbi:MULTISPECIES: hypothetical protein [Prauserella salsuginis group]|uniref:Glycerophosphoryl diester phosphodiesterase membrane domain-containing protein n=1 Tax=Prauserella salsuginis TaxID=387889 RepID=A0ABW6G6G8_9PSEU|nr:MULTISPECIES: hypothetical protein [Prauserella salsuginis group]MCR3722821.1 Uncharacterized protein family (UPF0259) [Prauserella flava]MCR3737124.1 Uncharacterized protein family (UPF0259) [Prauserella salsuginis]
MDDSSGMPHGDPGEPRHPSPGDGPAPGEAEAPQPGVIPLRPLRLAEITDGAVATMRRHAGVVFGAAALIALIHVVLVQVAELYLLPQPGRVWEMSVNALAVNAAFAFVDLLAHALVVGVLTVVVGRAVVGEPVTAGDVWAEFRPRLLPVLGLTIVVTAVTVAGLVLLVVPGVVAYVFLGLAVPALVHERHSGVTVAVRRSVNLVAGAWWHVCGRLFAALLITLLISVIIQLLVTQLLPLGAGTPSLADGTLAGHRLILGIGSVVAQTVAVPFSAAVTALIYLDQRMRREHLDTALRLAADRSG